MSPKSKQRRRITSPPVPKGFLPTGVDSDAKEAITLHFEEYEALRLADYSGLKQEDAARYMNISRPTFTRIYSHCLQKVARAFTEGRSIRIEGGDVELEKQWYRCNDCTAVFHQPPEISPECTQCESVNLEDINLSISEWKARQQRPAIMEEPEEYCICPVCGFEQLHSPGIPCFSNSCPSCHTSLIRKHD